MTSENPKAKVMTESCREYNAEQVGYLVCSSIADLSPVAADVIAPDIYKTKQGVFAVQCDYLIMNHLPRPQQCVAWNSKDFDDSVRCFRSSSSRSRRHH